MFGAEGVRFRILNRSPVSRTFPWRRFPLNLTDCFWVKRRAADTEQQTPISWNWQEPIKCVKISHVLCGQLQLYKLSEVTDVVWVSWDGSKLGADTQLDVTSHLWPLNWTNPFIRVIAATAEICLHFKGFTVTLENDEIAVNTPERLQPLRQLCACIQGFRFTPQKSVHLPPVLSVWAATRADASSSCFASSRMQIIAVQQPL